MPSGGRGRSPTADGVARGFGDSADNARAAHRLPLAAFQGFQGYFVYSLLVLAHHAGIWYARFRFQIDPLFLPGNRSLLLLLVGLCLFCLYVPLREFLNSTVITVERGCLTVVHTPLPGFRPPPLHIADITQFFVQREVYYLRGSKREVYRLWVQLRQGWEVCLMGGLEAPEPALFIEQQLEMFLGITDRPVPGELERR